MSDFLNYFDAWEPLLKARKAKGLDKWDRLKNISEKLQGKGMKEISFTCCHPSHSEPTRHLLGSVEGNLHFLLGYGNPGFHLAPYHWQVIDPNITDDQATDMSTRMHHPSNPVVWTEFGVSVGDEGDTTEGAPHPLFSKAKKTKQDKEKADAASFSVDSSAGSYTCYPTDQKVVGNHNGHVYAWDLVKDTFFSAQNPDAVEKMNNAGVVKALRGFKATPRTPTSVLSLAKSAAQFDFEEDVWPLVKSSGLKPGTVLRLSSSTGQTLYGVVTPTSVDLFSKSGSTSTVEIFDREYTSIDLRKGGSTAPAVILSFVRSNTKVNMSLVESVNKSTMEVTPEPQFVVDRPSPGWEDYEGQPIQKSVIRDGDVLRVVWK